MRIEFHPDVLKQLQKLPREVLEAALHVIIALADDHDRPGRKSW